MEHPRFVRVDDPSVVQCVKQEPVPREYYCRGVRQTVAVSSSWSRCGNMARYYVFVDGADEARQAVCGVCARKARSGRLTVLK